MPKKSAAIALVPKSETKAVIVAEGKQAHKSWTGSIVIGGALTIPCLLYTASRAIGFSFNQLHGPKRDWRKTITVKERGKEKEVPNPEFGKIILQKDTREKIRDVRPTIFDAQKQEEVENPTYGKEIPNPDFDKLLPNICGSRLKQGKMRCPECDCEVEREDIIKGYCLDEKAGKYLHVSEDELKAARPDADQMMELLKFVPADQVPPLYFESSYYLSPDEKLPRRTFNTLYEAMKQENKIGLAKVTNHSRQHLVFLMPFEKDGKPGMLAFYAYMVDEVQQISFPPAAEVNQKEVAMARKVIQAMSGDFDPTEYQDEYRENVGKMLEAKQENRVIPVIQQKKAPVEVDLESALNVALEAANKNRKRAS